jgi:hypothetical protein
MATAHREEGLRLAIEKGGGLRPLARALGIAPSSLLEWRRVPSYRILQVEMITGIPRETLRPDLYRPPQADQTTWSTPPMKPKQQLDYDIRILEIQIAVNEMLPPSMQCRDGIAAMKLKLAQLQQRKPSLTLVKPASS